MQHFRADFATVPEDGIRRGSPGASGGAARPAAPSFSGASHIELAQEQRKSFDGCGQLAVRGVAMDLGRRSCGVQAIVEMDSRHRR